MRYVIVCLIKGEALNFHEKLVKDVCSKFKVNRQRLPAHFTIKAPFETDNPEDVAELEGVISGYVMNKERQKMNITGIGHFRTNVVFMDIRLSLEALSLYKGFIDELLKLKWLKWKQNEGKNKIFHCTIVTKLFENKFKEIWDYLTRFNPQFTLDFDNISILIWENDRWVIYKEFKFN